MELHSQQKTFDVERGLFLIKYESSENTRNPPIVRVSPDDGSESSIELILPPDAESAVLWSPGASLAARAVQNARLRLVVSASEPGGSTAARVQIHVLDLDPAGMRQRDYSAPLDLSGFRILGHVAGRGDVLADADTWIAGPLAPSRIEGFAIQWPEKAPDMILRYSVTVGGPRPTMGPLVDAGNFAGTRGRALPLVGAILEISGATAQGHHLLVDSVFLGSPQMRTAGQRVVLSGPTGREPLVGLRIRIEAVEQSQASRPSAEPPYVQPDRQRAVQQPPALTVVADHGRATPVSAATPAQSKSSGRVRVFRSQSRKSHG
jgi:hypothetical protein